MAKAHDNESHERETSPFSLWLQNNHKSLLILFSAIGLLLVTTLLFFQSQRSQDQMTYLIAEKTADQILAGENGEKLKALDEILQAYPELHARYDAPIAQVLSQTEQKRATELAQEALGRAQLGATDPQLKPYDLYANTTLLIWNERYEEAFEESEQLNKTLKQTELTSLRAFNLLRLAVLSQKIEQPEKELLYWKELQAVGITDSLNTHLQVGLTPINQYIQSRLQHLQSSP